MNAGTKDDARSLDICLVEGDVGFREELVDALTRQGHAARGFPGSRELYAGLLLRMCEIAILDVDLPGEDGFAVARRLQGLGRNIGIIMLTDHAHSDDRVRALLAGADAYVQKPVALQELMAVVGSLARRVRLVNVPAAPRPAPARWSLSDDGWVLSGPPDVYLQLSGQERAFLQCLWRQLGSVVSRDALVRAVSDNPDLYDHHRLDMLVSRLRRKLAALGATLPLRSIRAQGYVVVATSERTDD